MKSYAHSPAMRPEVIVFGLKDWIIREYQKSSTKVAELEQSVDPNLLRRQIFDHLVSIVQTGSRAFMYLLVAMRPNHFGIPLASLTYLEQSTQNLFQKTYGLWGRIANLFHDMVAIQELFECIEIQPDIKSPMQPIEYERAISTCGTGMKIEMRKVSFKYPGKSEFVLKDISFVLEAGETLALLGFNGSGPTCSLQEANGREINADQIVVEDFRSYRRRNSN